MIMKCELVRKSNFIKGFTLVELLLYVGVSSTILLLSVIFLFTMVEARVKNQTIAEVEQQGIQVMQTITNAILGSQSINFPIVGTSASNIQLVLRETGNLVSFDVIDGKLRTTEAPLAPIFITNSRVVVSAILFENLSRSNTPGVVRVSFVLNHVNTEGRSEFNYSKYFYTSIALR
jgi:type II secretory pathway pseudopilin PulG